MKILWLTPLAPGPYSGAAVRCHHLLRLASRKHRIALVGMTHPDFADSGAELRSWGVEAHLVPYRWSAPRSRRRQRAEAWAQTLTDPLPRYARTYPLQGWRAAVQHLLKRFQPDVVHCEMLFAAPLMDTAPGIGAALDEHNVEWLNARRQADAVQGPMRRLAGRIEAWKLRRWERGWVQCSRAVMAVSEEDAAQLRGWAPDGRVSVVPNGVDCAAYAPPPGADAGRRGMLFFGNLGYAPNSDGVQYFCRAILPRVRQRAADAELMIAGPSAPAEVAALGAIPGVRYAGFLPDVRESLWSAALCVVPLRSGSGTRFKILEALAAGCAVVSTTIGAEGLGLTPGEEIAIADTPAEFADTVAELLRDAPERERMARNGQTAVRCRFDWHAVAPLLDAAHQLAAGHAV